MLCSFLNDGPHWSLSCRHGYHRVLSRSTVQRQPPRNSTADGLAKVTLSDATDRRGVALRCHRLLFSKD